MEKPDFCWICGAKWKRTQPPWDDSWDRNKWVLSEGPFVYGICHDCWPVWKVAKAIAKDVYTLAHPSFSAGRAEGAVRCIACRTQTYEGRHLQNHPRSLALTLDSYILCGDCRAPMDEARRTAIEARKLIA